MIIAGDSVGAVIRTSRRLADGREILYFDAEPVPRDAVDTRDLPPVATRSQLRYDALLGEWVAIASHRQTRTFLPPADECPLGPSRPGRPTEIPESRLPGRRLREPVPLAGHRRRAGTCPPTAPGNPVAELRPGFGRCEVVCFTDEHDRVFADLGPERARLVVDVWADRTEALGAIEGVEYVFPFENHGEEIGVTLSHPHGQIYAYPYLPPRAEKMLGVGARGTGRATGGDLFADVVAAERAGPRVVDGQRALDGVRAGRRALAVRGPAVPDPPGARPPGADRRRARRLRRGLPRRAGPVRPALRRPDALHRRLEPGAGAAGPRGLVAAPAAVLAAAGARQAEVPRRVGVGHGRVHHRHEPRGRRRAAAELVVA